MGRVGPLPPILLLVLTPVLCSCSAHAAAPHLSPSSQSTMKSATPTTATPGPGAAGLPAADLPTALYTWNGFQLGPTRRISETNDEVYLATIELTNPYPTTIHWVCTLSVLKGAHVGLGPAEAVGAAPLPDVIWQGPCSARAPPITAVTSGTIDGAPG